MKTFIPNFTYGFMTLKRILPYALSLLLVGCSANKQSLEKRQAGSLNFGFVTDTHFPNETADSLINRISRSGIEFLLHGGDIVHVSKNEDGWQSAVEAMKRSGIPWYPAVGNHDGRGIIERHFKVPEYYGFEKEECYFLSLNTQEIDFDEQLIYTRDKLKSWKGKGPIFVYFHKPIFSSHMDVQIPRKKLETIFRETGVDFVLMGHEHHYTRFKELNGVHYIIGGSGSTKDSPEEKNSAEEVKLFENHYINIKIEGDSAFMRAVNLEGKTVDSIGVNWRSNDKKIVSPFVGDIKYLGRIVPYLLDEAF